MSLNGVAGRRPRREIQLVLPGPGPDLGLERRPGIQRYYRVGRHSDMGAGLDRTRMCGNGHGGVPECLSTAAARLCPDRDPALRGEGGRAGRGAGGRFRARIRQAFFPCRPGGGRAPDDAVPELRADRMAGEQRPALHAARRADRPGQVCDGSGERDPCKSLALQQLPVRHAVLGAGLGAGRRAEGGREGAHCAKDPAPPRPARRTAAIALPRAAWHPSLPPALPDIGSPGPYQNTDKAWIGRPCNGY